MAFRTAAYWKSMVNSLRGRSPSFTTPTVKAYSTTADRSLPSTGGIKSKCFGLYTAWHQLARAPDVAVKKSRRETIAEVVEPEVVAKDAERFVKKSLFRKIAHIQDQDQEAFHRGARVETLKDVGVAIN